VTLVTVDAVELLPDTLDPESLRLAYEEGLKSQPMQSEWADAVDKKVVAVFTVSALLIGVAPALKHAAFGSPAWWCFLIAMAFWCLAGGCAVFAYQARALQVLHPQFLLSADWLGSSVNAYRYHRLRFIGELHEANAAALDQKARWLKRSIRFTAAEVLAIAVALILAP
jgi:hypothetical protein